MPPRLRTKRIADALEQFRWLMNAKAGEKCETAENIACALEWVLKIGTRKNGNPIPELLDEIRKLRPKAKKTATPEPFGSGVAADLRV